MIPIREKIGRVCGFTARKLSVTPEWGDKKAPNTSIRPKPTSSKKANCFLIMTWRTRRSTRKASFLLVEGQLDAIRCWAEGFKTVVAPQGTAFGDNQANLFKNQTPEASNVYWMVMTRAKKAAFDYIPIFLSQDLVLAFPLLPGGDRPRPNLARSRNLRLAKAT